MSVTKKLATTTLAVALGIAMVSGTGISAVAQEEQKEATVHVSQFGGYDVRVYFKLINGKIEMVNVDGSNYIGNHAETNKNYLKKAFDGLRDRLNGISATEEAISKVDVVSEATISSNAIKEAIYKALGIEKKTEQLDPSKALPNVGEYTVEVKDTTEAIPHAIAPEKTKAVLKVTGKNQATLTYSIVKEPSMLIYKYNGYYKNNQKGSELLIDGSKTTTEEVKEKEFIEVSHTKVSSVTVPITSRMNKYYHNYQIYVPAMKELDKKTDSGMVISKGKFAAISDLEVNWKTLKRKSNRKLKDGIYTIPTTVVQTDKKKPSMARGAFGKLSTVTVKKGVPMITITLSGMKVGSQMGYLGKMSYYASGYSFRDGVISGKTKAVKVLNKQTAKKAKSYPRTVSFPIIPEAVEDGYIPASVYIPAMGSTRQIFIKVKWSGLKKAVKKISVPTVAKIKAKALGKRKVRISWKKIKKVSGYVVYRATKAKGKFKKAGVLKKDNAVTFTQRKLKKKAIFYYVVKAYVKKGGKIYYGKQSKVVKVRVK